MHLQTYTHTKHMYISIHSVGALCCYGVVMSSPLHDNLNVWSAGGSAELSLVWSSYISDCEIFRTVIKVEKVRMWSSLVLMALHVQCQVVWTREAATAGDTFEGFCAGVFAVMPRQFIRAGKTPVTSFPAALVWLLTYYDKNHNKS